MNTIEEIPLNSPPEYVINPIRNLASKAEQPVLMICGKECRPARRVINVGNSYYYKNGVSLDWGDSTNFLKILAPEANQCLINVYDDKTSNIGWHIDRVSNLKGNYVVSISFAKNQEDISKVLAVMEFRQGKKGKAFLKIPLKHGTCLKFNAVEHSKAGIYHRVAKTEFPRINLTFREVSE